MSSAVILEPEKESVRYFLVYGTNAIDRLIVFKKAEIVAARIQDRIRDETRTKKTGQFEFQFGSDTPNSGLAESLRKRYVSRAKKKVIDALKRNPDTHGTPYEEVFREAMAFPLVSPDDLENWIKDWSPSVTLKLEASDKRRKKTFTLS